MAIVFSPTLQTQTLRPSGLSRMPIIGGEIRLPWSNDVVGTVVSVRQVKRQILRANWEACLIAARVQQLLHRFPTVSPGQKCEIWPLIMENMIQLPTSSVPHTYHDQAQDWPECLSFLETQQSALSHFEHFVTCCMPIASSEVVIDSFIARANVYSIFFTLLQNPD